MSFFDYIQTFYVNPDAVNGALEVNLASVELFFKSKPSTVSNISGIANPGITVWICSVSNNQPSPQKMLDGSMTYVKYPEINTSGNASVGTNASFKNTVSLLAGQYYGIVVKYDDPAFNIWINKQGDRLVNETGPTNNASVGSQGKFEGQLYKATNSNEYIPLSDQDLKFKANIAQFISTNGTFNIANKAYEFFTIDSPTGGLLGGETVWQETADQAGTVSISSASANVVGTGTSFSSHIAGQSISVSQGGATDIVKIKNVANDTFIELESYPLFSNTSTTYKLPAIGTVYYADYTQKKLVLVDSNAANSTYRFVTGSRLYGEQSGSSANVVSIDRYKIDTFVPKFAVSNPSASEYNITYALANTSNGISTFSNLEMLKDNTPLNESYIISRSQEVVENSLYGASNRSIAINVEFNVVVSNTNLFTAPKINANQLDFFVYQNEVNNVADTLETRYGLLNFDTEIEKNGLAISKAILKKVDFAADRSAEDLRLYLTAYRPAGTQINVYAKIHNATDKEAFDDKQWTPLQLKENVDKFSNDNPNNLIEYTYGFPQYPESYENLTGQFTVQSGNNIVLASVDPSANVITGNTIKIYDPITPENHEIFVVEAANTTSITVNKPVTNVNIIGNMYVDRLKYNNVAWNNIANDNVVRYVNSSSVEFDTFNSMQLKVVFYADNTLVVPRAEQIQAIGVSS